ncbi:MAG: TIGR01440 family protein [Paenibacillaceae bacterium]
MHNSSRDQVELQVDSTIHWESMADQMETVLTELIRAGSIEAGQIIVFGTSTSEVMGSHIGTSGSLQVAGQLYLGIERVRQRVGFYPAFQCCEHLNRALLVEKEVLLRFPTLEQVSVIPVPKAGGAMASYVHSQLGQPVLVETIQAHAGVDIGGTLIGMHLRRVAVPFRPTIRVIGHAPVQAAYTRPKLIGGVRAVYTLGG